MSENGKKSRREFFKATTALGAMAFASGGYLYYHNSSQTPLKQAPWRLNPGFRLREISENEIELFTHFKGGERLQYCFRGLEADLLRAVAAGKLLAEEISSMAKKNCISEKKCKTELNKYLKILSDAKLVYYGQEIPAKKMESIYARTM